VYTPKPHVSAALRHLWFSVVLCAITLAACIVLQTFITACVHFSDARWTTVEAPATPGHPLTVVQQQGEPTSVLRPTTGERAAAGAQVNRVLSKSDRWFKIASGLAQTFGVISALALALVMIQGVLVAAGGAVPGVERAVSATTWTIVIALVCLPLSSILPAMPYHGVFSSYGQMTELSEALRRDAPEASGTMFHGQHFVFPFVVLFALALAVYRFRLGVEQGVIVTSVSELDEKLAREMASIKVAATTAPRSVGALHRAIGEEAEDVISPGLTRAVRDANRADAKLPPMRRIGQPTSGDPLERPI
jgi:hypothetical protein